MLALRTRLFGILDGALKAHLISCDYSLEADMVTKKKKDRDGALKKLVVVSPAVPPSLQVFVTRSLFFCLKLDNQFSSRLHAS